MLRQLSVFVENEVGSLAKITSVLRENGINLRAISSFDSPEFGIMRMIVDKPEHTKEILTSKGFVVKIIR
ncbi:MAG: ACT domain-containing protein [Anaerocolumna sp.]